MLFVAVRAHRFAAEELRGDEGTYVAMTASLAHDRDLEFGEADAARARAHAGGETVILQRTPSGVAYSKPVVYPLVAAAFFAAAGERGMAVANALVLAVAFWLAVAPRSTIIPSSTSVKLARRFHRCVVRSRRSTRWVKAAKIGSSIILSRVLARAVRS